MAARIRACQGVLMERGWGEIQVPPTHTQVMQFEGGGGVIDMSKIGNINSISCQGSH